MSVMGIKKVYRSKHKFPGVAALCNEVLEMPSPMTDRLLKKRKRPDDRWLVEGKKIAKAAMYDANGMKYRRVRE